MLPTLNGGPIIARFGGVIFVRIPLELQRPIDSCHCDYCKRTGEPPTWDTLAVPVEPDQRHAWTVHMPDPVATQASADRHAAKQPRRRG